MLGVWIYIYIYVMYCFLKEPYNSIEKTMPGALSKSHFAAHASSPMLMPGWSETWCILAALSRWGFPGGTCFWVYIVFFFLSLSLSTYTCVCVCDCVDYWKLHTHIYIYFSCISIWYTSPSPAGSIFKNEYFLVSFSTSPGPQFNGPNLDWVSPTQKEIPKPKEIWKRRFLLSKNFPTYPWNIPQTQNQQFMVRSSFNLGGWGGLGYAPWLRWGSLRYCWWFRNPATTQFFPWIFSPVFFINWLAGFLNHQQ